MSLWGDIGGFVGGAIGTAVSPGAGTAVGATIGSNLGGAIGGTSGGACFPSDQVVEIAIRNMQPTDEGASYLLRVWSENARSRTYGALQTAPVPVVGEWARGNCSKDPNDPGQRAFWSLYNKYAQLAGSGWGGTDVTQTPEPTTWGETWGGNGGPVTIATAGQAPAAAASMGGLRWGQWAVIVAAFVLFLLIARRR